MTAAVKVGILTQLDKPLLSILEEEQWKLEYSIF